MSRSLIFDWTLQLAAVLGVIFVLGAGVARGAALPEADRIVIEDALRAGVSPSLALAVTRLGNRREIRADIEHLAKLTAQYPGRVDFALARYRFGSIAIDAEARRYIAAVRAHERRFDEDARRAARALRKPMIRRAALDDFDATIAARLRLARRTLDDFPLRPHWREG
jgi:hypothetical protein